MILPSIGVVAGLVLLSYAADQFVIGAARIATALRVSSVMIGAVVIGFGTSAPELVASTFAAAQGSADLAVGNVIGSNVANLTLVMGIAALVTPVATSAGVLRREAPLSVLAVLVFAFAVWAGLHVWHGVMLVAVLAGSLWMIVRSARSDPQDAEQGYGAQVEGFTATRAPDRRRETVRTLVALVVTVGSAKLLIDSAVLIAERIGLAEGFVGLTIVAVGTSLPELATAVQAARRNETDLIVGNLLGSNLFNAGAVGATVAFVAPGRVTDPVLIGPANLLMAAVVLVSLVFMASGGRIRRAEGGILLLAYLVAIPFLAG